MKCRLALFCSLIWVASLTGCAYLGKEARIERPDAFLNRSLQEAAKHETGGEWDEALRAYKIALTLSPENREALEGRKRAEGHLKRLSEEQYRLGRELQREGKLSEARRRFLIALRLWPNHEQALATLTSRKRLPAHEYVLHKLRQGESLSQLAMMYYGDPAKFPVIARFNQISDAHLVQVGQEIKVPVLAGLVKRSAADERLEVSESDIPPGYWDWSSSEAEQAERKMPSETAKAEKVDQIAIYRDLGAELFREGRYQEALLEFQKVLTAYPEDQLASDYSYTASFEMGLLLFQTKDYLRARDYFRASLKYRSDCQQSRALMKQSEDLYKEVHYKRGIESYGKEQLAEAIREWEMVQELDPNYKRVDYYILKAKEIQQKLKELKQETQESLLH